MRRSALYDDEFRRNVLFARNTVSLEIQLRMRCKSICYKALLHLIYDFKTYKRKLHQYKLLENIEILL